MRRVGLAALILASTIVFLALITHQVRSNSGASAMGRKILYYRDPMHPSHISDHPGKAPDCGMELVAVFAEDGEAALSTQIGDSNEVEVSLEQQQTLGIQVARVVESVPSANIRTLGRVVAEEDRLFPITAGAEGWITQVAPRTATGELVKKGQTLAVVYGREYATAERTFLYALRGLETATATSPGDYQDQQAVVLREARLVLENMGFGAAQIEQLSKTRRVILDVNITSPVDGVIVSRGAFLQKKFERGAELFRIADLSRVWIAADLFAIDASRIRNGATASVSIVDRPGYRFRATVSDSLSSFDEKSRTLKLRLEVENPGLLLRPDMFVNVEFSLESAKAVSVSTESVVVAESGNIVFVQRHPGVFEARSVKTGSSSAGRVQVLEGLKPGEIIVISGSFFLDSERRLRSQAANRHD
jgi:membrane fusion protein, copper/silver efflux system